MIGALFVKNPLFKKQQVPIHTTQLPQLRVEGNRIFRLDTNKPVQLKGVSTMAFVRYHYSKDELLKRLNMMKSWNINLVGIFVNPNTLQGQEKLLDEVVLWSTQSKTYIYIIPAVDILDEKNSVADQGEKFKAMMIALSKKYAKSHNIIYGMWAEPRNVPWEAWKPYMTSVGTQIRDNSPTSLLLITGIQYGRYINVQDPVLLPNTILDYHDYPWASVKEAQNKKMYSSEWLWDDAVQKSPVLIGEFGGMYESDFGSEEDISYIQSVLNQVNKNNLHYTAYTIDSEGELGLYNWDQNIPTKKGDVIKVDLSLHPPTSF